MTSDVTCQIQRNEMIAILRKMARPQYQYDVWIKRQYDKERSGLDHCINFFFDDTFLYENLSSEIGKIIHQSEAKAIAHFIKIFDKILDQEYEDTRTVEGVKQYISDPYWPDLIQSARKALCVMAENDRSISIPEEWKE